MGIYKNKDSLLKQLNEVVQLVSEFTNKQQRQPELLEMIERAKKEWQWALSQLNYCDQDMLEFIVHEIQARERRYIALIKQARQEKLTAWPSSIISYRSSDIGG